MTDDYRCPECGKPRTKPLWLVARELGFDQMVHCALMANRFGRVVLCYHRQTHLPPAPGYGERQGWRACDLVYRCPISVRFTTVETDSHGRTKEVAKA